MALLLFSQLYACPRAPAALSAAHEFASQSRADEGLLDRMFLNVSAVDPADAWSGTF